MSDYKELKGYHLWSDQYKNAQGKCEDPVIALVDRLLYQALNERASDIHLEPFYQENTSENSCEAIRLRVRLRIDGLLSEHLILDREKDAVISRLKVLASLDIAQQRLAQDGKFRLIYHPDDYSLSRAIDIRVASFPCLYGEKIVLRLLDAVRGLKKFTELGMTEVMADSVRRYLSSTSSLLLVTGPTGSGKTTTLYSFLSHLNHLSKNIVTMEDPIEYELLGINQSQVNEQAGFSFEVGLRSMLRQDPDYLMIGEIRDKKTVTIAIEAALTGHLVLSTLHTTNAALVITRLIDMGVEPFLVSAALGGILAQRLVRLLCQACCKKQPLLPEQKIFFERFFQEQLVLKKELSFPQELSVPVGCQSCSGRGYKDRIAIFEWIACDQEIKALILQRASSQEIALFAQEKGHSSLVQDAFDKLSRGLIDYQEFLVISLDG